MIDKVTAAPHISPPEKDAKPVRLLLVEDSDADAYLITSAARELSYALEIQRFVTADRAIAGLEAGLPAPPQGDLPGGSGLDVLRSIRGNKQTRNLRVVVMTSSISIRDREAAELLGVDGYLLKPSDYKLFVDAVGVALRSIFGGG